MNKRRFNVDQSRKFKCKPEPGLWSMDAGQGLSASQAIERDDKNGLRSGNLIIMFIFQHFFLCSGGT